MAGRMSAAPSIPPPSVYGLPAKFAHWRVNQAEAAMRSIESPKRFPTIVAPCGFGKCACAETIARYLRRSCYLTATHGLQDQIVEEIHDRYDLRGKSNYDCRVLADQGITGWQARVVHADAMCDQCAWRDQRNGCEYYERGRRAKAEQHVITNYAKWLSTEASQMGDFDVLICDEAHNCPSALSSALRVEIRAEHVEEFCGQRLPGSRPIDEWSAWGAHQMNRLRPKFEALISSVAAGNRSKVAQLRNMKALVRGLEGLSALSPDWLEDRSTHDRVAFEPVWPRGYGELLFRGIPKIVMLSATVHPKTLDMLGVDSAQVDFAEYPSSFPVERRPVMWVRTVQQRFGMSEDEIREAVRRVDQIIDARLDRKGIVHTVSFDRAKQIMRWSRHSSVMLLNDSKLRDTAEVIERFKQSGAPRVLVTPSVKEGYDFAGDLAEYQVIYKVPLLNRKSSPIADARCKEDPDYDNFQAMQSIVQMSGRIVRSDTDAGETIITDDAWGNWFLRSAERFAPRWFMAAYKGEVSLPRPLPKL